MTFVKGQSGNPGGRPKVVGAVQELARKHTKAAIDTMASIMKDKEAAPAARVAAANGILDRGYGKPAQKHSGDADNPIKHVHQIERLIVRPETPDTDG